MLLSILSMRAGGLINNAAVASEIGLDNKTYEKYKAAIINTFIIFELPPWATSSKINKRFTKSAKLFFNDTNLLVYLMRRDIREIYKNKESIMGHLFENFIASEIMKNTCYLPNVTVSHFRTTDNKEVDFVIERAQGDTIGIEVKLDSVVNENDFKGLKVLRKVVGEKFKKGIVLYTGTEIVTMGENFWAVPVCFLVS
jgi:predicted AAA+ superfamily ATPase